MFFVFAPEDHFDIIVLGTSQWYIVERINEVTLRRAGLVLRWVTVREYIVLVFNQVTQANSAWPSLRG